MRVYSVVDEDYKVRVFSDVVQLVAELPDFASDHRLSTKPNPKKEMKDSKLVSAIVENANAGEPTDLYTPGGSVPELIVRAHEV